ncbi:UNVERIFIED_ORG: hypothetical protein OKW15_004951 [Pseudomonas reinekei]|nr:hypothetical protein [Pseudomonas reinekei]
MSEYAEPYGSKLPNDLGGSQVLRSTAKPVGAGLLAKAVGQSTSMLNVRPLSRASRIAAPPLPQ